MSSKVTPPPASGCYERPRLFDALERGGALAPRVIWLGAPAGAGKSTLIASYLKARDVPHVWYNFDARDADAASLFHYLKQAAEATAGASDVVLPPLVADHPAHRRAFARRFFEALFAKLPAGSAVVIDDCPPPSSHWEGFYQTIAEAAEAVPPGASIIISARGGLPSRLTRLLAASKLMRLDWSALRFSTAEAEELVELRSSQLGLKLLPRQKQELVQKADGWAAGIVLSLECARQSGGHVDEGLTGHVHDSFEYFAAEVWDCTAPDLKRVLAETAWLPRLSPALLDYLYGEGHGRSWLQRLRAEQAFVSDIHGLPGASSYHPLFRAFLRERAQRDWPQATLGAWQRRAALSLAATGDVEAALELQLACRDYSAACESLLRHGEQLLAQGRAHALASYLHSLPTESLERAPRLAWLAAVANLDAAPQISAEHARFAFDAFERDGDEAGYWQAWRVLVFARSRAGTTFEKLWPVVERAFRRLGEGQAGNSELELRICRTAAFAAGPYLPDDPRVLACAERVITSPLRSDPEELAIALFHFGLPGEIGRLDAFTQRWLAASSEEPSVEGRLWLALCRSFAAAFRGDFDAAARVAAEGIDLAERSGTLQLSTTLYAYWSYSCVGSGNLEGLQAVLRSMEQNAEVGSLLELSNYRFARGLSALLHGDFLDARPYLELAYEDAKRMAIPVAECAHGLGLCEALLALGLLREARLTLEQVVARLPRRSLTLRQSARLMTAAVGYASDDAIAGNAALLDALALTRQYGLVPLPVPTRRTLEPLLERAAAQQLDRPSVDFMAARFGFDSLRLSRSGESEPPPTTRSAVPPWFVSGVRCALRRFHETQMLLDNPLLESPLVGGEATSTDQRVRGLRRCLVEGVERLAASARTEPYYRALRHTFLEPAQTQLLAAERAAMSFGTYRRHLASGVQEVAAELWLSLVRLEDAGLPSSRPRSAGPTRRAS